MKRLVKKLAGSLWRISVPVRRPVVRKFDRHMLRLLGSSSVRAEIPANLELALGSVASELARLQSPPANLELALGSVVRELARLQIQVEILQQQIEGLESSERDGARSESRLLVVGDMG